MKRKRSQKKLAFGILMLISSLFLWNCEKDEIIVPTLQQKQLEVTIAHWYDLKQEKSILAKNLEKFRDKNLTSRDVQSSEYGFTINEEKVQIIVNENYTTYTFFVEREENQNGILENYVYKEYEDGSYGQFLLTYYYTFDEEGNKIFDTNNLGVAQIDDESLLVNRNPESGDCHPHFEQIENGMICTYNERCTGYLNHEIGNNCPCDGNNGCFPPQSNVCVQNYIYEWNDCSGGLDTGDVDNPNDPNNISTGGGQTQTGTGCTTNGNTNAIPFDIRLGEFESSLDDDELDWWSNPNNSRKVTILISILEGDLYSDSSEEYVRSIINLHRDTSLTDDERFLEFTSIYDVYDSPLDITASQIDFEARIREYAREFRRRGQAEFANYLERIIPFDPSTTIGEILDVFEVIRQQNLALSYQYAVEILTTTIVSFEPVIKLALTVVGGRFALVLLQRLPSLYVTTYIANVITRLGIPASTAFTAFQHAKKFGIQTYAQLQQEFVNLGISANNLGVHRHHLVEQRFINIQGIKDWLGVTTANWSSIVLTPEEHQVFTNAWRAAIATSNMNNPGWTNTFTHNATLEDVKEAARVIYANYPEILEALGL